MIMKKELLIPIAVALLTICSNILAGQEVQNNPLLMPNNPIRKFLFGGVAGFVFGTSTNIIPTQMTPDALINDLNKEGSGFGMEFGLVGLYVYGDPKKSNFSQLFSLSFQTIEILNDQNIDDMNYLDAMINNASELNHKVKYKSQTNFKWLELSSIIRWEPFINHRVAFDCGLGLSYFFASHIDDEIIIDEDNPSNVVFKEDLPIYKYESDKHILLSKGKIRDLNRFRLGVILGVSYRIDMIDWNLIASLRYNYELTNAGLLNNYIHSIIYNCSFVFGIY
jgi:hypothetical protein